MVRQIFANPKTLDVRYRRNTKNFSFENDKFFIILTILIDPPDRHYDFDARRTDIRNRQDGLAFQLDTNFWRKPERALLKVTFVDREKASWHIEYTGSQSTKRTTAKVQNSGDGQRKTATFAVDALAAARSFPGDMDFRLVTDGPGDVTVTMVRILKGEWKEA